jgi:TonB-linked SusC/RagA family outer membrane protein
VIPRKLAVACLGIGVAWLLTAGAAAAQTGTITGTVTNSQNGQALQGAQISVIGTSIGTLSQETGRYMLLNVPGGRRTLRVEFIGYATTTVQVNVVPDHTATMNIELKPEAIALQQIVVTGTAGATQKSKVPFDVDQINSSQLPVPTVNPATAIQGKVAGVQVVSGSGRPGSNPSILLRGPTSIDAAGRSQDPLYIVDGVILQSGLVDLDALDIKSIEIVKGAAAASLYGSRAAAGVIQITTKTGSSLQGDQVRYTIRSEYGQSGLASYPSALLSEYTPYAMSGGQFLEKDGTTCDWLSCGSQPALAGQLANGNIPGRVANGDTLPSQWNTYQAVKWPGKTYNQVKRFFTSGLYMQNYFAAEGRSGATNYHVSISNLQDQGVMRFMKGFNRTNFRVNLDQTVLENLQVQASAFYSRSTQNQFPETQGNPMFNLTRMPAGVNLLAPDPTDPSHVVLVPDPSNTESPNPIYEIKNRDYTEGRGRFLGSADVRFSPLSWVDFDANASFDRLNSSVNDLYPKGYATPTPNQNLNNGHLEKDENVHEALNASITATMNFQLTENIHNRTMLRYLYESDVVNRVQTYGPTFAVADVPTLANLDQSSIQAWSQDQTIRSDGYFVITNFDLMDRYVIDALVRNDGSSLFGADQRRQWYYRIGGAWRMAQEPWFHVPGIDQLKLRYSLGTAGGRPRFEAQYETYSVSNGRISPVNLGNKNLRPELSTEQEAGVDASFFGGKLGTTLTYSNTVTKDQILDVPLPAYSGYGHQWRNAGTLSSNTYEASIDGRLYQSRNMRWSARLIFSKTKSTITKLTEPAFQYGVDGQGLGTVFYAREGETMGTFYGVHYATSCADLPQGVSCDGFKVNNDGWLVWTGSNPDNTWGTSSSSEGLTIRGSPVMWGTPFAGECTDRSTGERTLFCPVGHTMPDYTAGLSSTLTWKNLTLYGLLDAVQGFDVYNQPLQWGVFKGWAGLFDQSSLPGANATPNINGPKPLGYVNALYSVSGLQPSNVFVEDGSFVKLREVSLSYRLTPEQLSGIPGLNRFSSIGFTLTGNNLFTWTKYRGFDPEVGKTGGDTGSAALARVAGYQYPNFRTWTAAIELNF